MVDKNLRIQTLFEQNRKSKGVAYLLWFFFGFLGVHRFYAGKTKSGVIQLLLSLTVVGLLFSVPWVLIDALLIPGMINERNLKTIEMINGGPLQDTTPAHRLGEPAPPSNADRKREAMLEDLRATGYKKERRDLDSLYR